MTIDIAPPGFERFFVLDNPLRVVEERAYAGSPDVRRSEPAAAVQSMGPRFSRHAAGHQSGHPSPARARLELPARERAYFSKSPGEIAATAVVAAAELSTGDWANLDASAAPSPRGTAHRYAPAETIRGTTVSVMA